MDYRASRHVPRGPSLLLGVEAEIAIVEIGVQTFVKKPDFAKTSRRIIMQAPETQSV